MAPRRGFQSIWFSLIVIIPEGMTSCCSPGQPFSGPADAGVSNVLEDAAALCQGCASPSCSQFSTAWESSHCLWNVLRFRRKPLLGVDETALRVDKIW